MANIILVTAEEGLAAELLRVLDPQQHRITLCEGPISAIAALRVGSTGCKLIALNMSRNRNEEWEALDRISEAVAFSGAAIKIVCFSLVYWGAQMQLAVERRGARFVYIQ